MKVSNCTTAKITAYTIVVVMTAMLFCIAVIPQTILDGLLLASIMILIVALSKIRVVTYEFSGGCVTIRKIHPFTFKKFISPEIEFPQNYIKDYNVKNNMVLGFLVLKVKSKRNKNYAVKVRLYGFSSSQRQKIKTSLFSIVSENNLNQIY